MRSLRSIAIRVRSTALYMFASKNGSGSIRRRVGLRKSTASLAPIPRATNSAATIGDMSAARESSRTESELVSRHVQRRPENERLTPKVRAGEGAMASASMFSEMPSLHPAHGAGRRAHDDAFRGDGVALHVHTIQHRAIGHASGGEDHVARCEVHQRIFAVEIGDAELQRAGALLLLLEHKPRLD